MQPREQKYIQQMKPIKDCSAQTICVYIHVLHRTLLEAEIQRHEDSYIDVNGTQAHNKTSISTGGAKQYMYKPQNSIPLTS